MGVCGWWSGSALPQGAAVMTGLSAAMQPRWAWLITDSSPTGELCGATWHHSTRFSSRLPLGLCWQWVSLEFTLPVNKSLLHQTDGNRWIIGSTLLSLHATLVLCHVQWCGYCVVWVCASILSNISFVNGEKKRWKKSLHFRVTESI